MCTTYQGYRFGASEEGLSENTIKRKKRRAYIYFLSKMLGPPFKSIASYCYVHKMAIVADDDLYSNDSLPSVHCSIVLHTVLLMQLISHFCITFFSRICKEPRTC